MNEKQAIVADILEEDLDQIQEDRELESYDNWDSVAVLALISIVSERTGVFLHAKDLEKLVTIKDLYEVLG